MNEQVKTFIDKYPSEIIGMYNNIRQIIFDSVSFEPEEVLWAKLPSYYVDEAFVRLIPFKDHINIEASSITMHQEELAGYKITPKGIGLVLILVSVYKREKEKHDRTQDTY